MEGLWSVMTVIGPILLLAVLIFAVVRNRTTRAGEQRTDAATRALYAEEDKKTQRDEAV